MVLPETTTARGVCRFLWSYLGFLQILGTFWASLFNKDYNVWGSILGAPVWETTNEACVIEFFPWAFTTITLTYWWLVRE